jgi:predicted MPP superfamily phosphohydrolase
MLTRRKFLLGLAGSAVAGAGSIAYTWRLEPRWLDVTETAVALPEPLRGAPLRILHLSDLHAGRWAPMSYLRSAVQRGIALRPDLICVTGDFYTCGDRWDDGAYVAVLAPLAAAAPTFATLGNHDGGSFSAAFFGERTIDRVAGLLARSGIRWLHNDRAVLERRGRRIHLVGLGDLWNGHCRPEIAFHGFSPKPDELTLALSHNPDSKEFLMPYRWDLLLSGHTHGGQVGLPFLARRFAPVRDKRFLAGLYPYEGRQLYITRGVGTLHGARLFCRPEVSLLTV